MKSKNIKIKELFSEGDKYSNLYEGNTACSYFFNTRMNIISNLLYNIKGGNLLDVGCGPGIMLKQLVNTEFNIHGIDISKSMIQTCKKHFYNMDSVNLYIGSAENLPFKDSSFDVILCMGVLEYPQNIGEVICELKRVLKQNGYIIVTMLNILSPYRFYDLYIINMINWIFGKLLKKKYNKRLESNLYTECEFRKIFKNYQLKTIECVYYDFNIFFNPLDKYFPRHENKINIIIENLSKKISVLRYLGTGYILKIQKI